MHRAQTDLYEGSTLEKGDWIEELRPGLTVQGVFAVVQAAARPTKGGTSFLSLELQDRTGRIGAVGWEHAHMAPKIKPGSTVHLTGVVDTYQGQPQIKIADLKLVTDKVEPGHFLPEGQQDKDTLRARLAEIRGSITTPYLKTLLEKVFEEEGLLEPYLEAPAAKLRHQAYIGGLAEHSLNMAEHARYCSSFYPELDGDMLVTAALLHDLGKIFEYRFDTVIDYSDVGRLEGHIVIGDRIISRAATSIADFPEEARLHLSHLILSHQGRLEYGSPVTPKTLEAIVLYALDLLDSRVATFRDIRDRYEGEDRTWSDYDRLSDQFWYLKVGK